MSAVLVATACSVFASSWALRQLRSAATVLSFDPALITRALSRGEGMARAVRLDRAMSTDRDAWEACLVERIVGARSSEEAQGEANAAVLEADGRLAAATRVYAACARIAVFGCLLGAAMLFMVGEGLTLAVLDVFAIGAAGVLVSLAAGKEAQRYTRRKRADVDGWVESLMKVRWAGQGCAGETIQRGT